jgi:hypothetical protein
MTRLTLPPFTIAQTQTIRLAKSGVIPNALPQSAAGLEKQYYTPPLYSSHPILDFFFTASENRG